MGSAEIHTGPQYTFRELVTFTAEEWRVLAISMALCLAARVSCLLHAYSIDDYSLIIFGSAPANILRQSMTLGRWGQGILWYFMSALGIRPTHGYVISTIGLLVALVWLGAITCRVWRLKDPGIAFLVTAMLSLYPYQAEVFTFKSSIPFFLAAALFLAGAALYWGITYKRVLPAALLVTGSLSLYQVSLNYVLMILTLGLALELARYKSGPHQSAREECSQVFANLFFWPRFFSIVGGVGIYLVVNKLVNALSGAQLDSRGVLLGVKDIPERVAASMRLLASVFFKPEPIMGAGPKILLLSILGLAVGALIRKALRADRTGRCCVESAAVLTIVTFGAIWIIGMAMVPKVFWPVPRVMSHAGLFWAGICAIAGTGWSGPARRATFITAGILLFSFVEINNGVYADQLRVNLRDMNTASRIVGRLEAMPGFDRVTHVAVFGGHWWYPASIETTQGDMNISAFGAAWSRVAVLNEVSGYRLTQSYDQSVLKAGEDWCQTSPKWPAPESVRIAGDTGLVCMPAQP